MSTNKLLIVVMLLWLVAAGCSDKQPYARAFRIVNRAQTIGGSASLAELGDLILENDKIRLAVTELGNSVGPGVFGGSLVDADVQRSQARFRGGRGKDQFGELFPVGNLTIPAVCQRDGDEHDSFCQRLPKGVWPSVRILCDGQSPCVLDPSQDQNADYALEDAMPSAQAAIIRVEGQAGNYIEALGLVELAKVKMNFRFRNDYILEPGVSYVRIRTLLEEADFSGSPLEGEMALLPPLTGPTALFGVLLGSDWYQTELENLQPGIAGGDFMFFGERLNVFAPGVGFDLDRVIRQKAATGIDPFNFPLAADFIAGVGENVSYAISSSHAGGKVLVPIYSGAVTAGFTHAAHCHIGPCPGTQEQCKNVLDCIGIRSFVFERVFAVGDGDVASAAAVIYGLWNTPMGRLRGHVLDQRTGHPVSGAEVHVYSAPENMGDCRAGLEPDHAKEPYRLGPEQFVEACLVPGHFMGAVSHLRADRRATDMPSGYFEGRLPVGRYYLLAKKPYRTRSQVVEVEVVQDETREANLHLLPAARIQFEVRDEQGRRIPAKFTVGQCFPNPWPA